MAENAKPPRILLTGATGYIQLWSPTIWLSKRSKCNHVLLLKPLSLCLLTARHPSIQVFILVYLYASINDRIRNWVARWIGKAT